MCFCEDGKHQPNCSLSNFAHTIHAFPGQVFSLNLAVVGSKGVFNGVVSGAIRAFNVSYDGTLGLHQSSQTSNKSICNNFNYSINSTEDAVTFQLAAEEIYLSVITQGGDYLSVPVHLKDCPARFLLSNVTSGCECDPVLGINKIYCNIDDETILRPANSWIGFIDEFNNTGTLFHPNCPIKYCLPRDVKITINTSDGQCGPHRTGLLCGKCEEGYSLTLGDQKCEKCSNTYLLLILPFAMAGLLLVAILFALDLTVTEGSINGLVFYANVIAMNDTILSLGGFSYLYTFVAWLNLDLGIQTCLFDGLDGYTETWLQFLFPFYLWMLILFIIQFYRKFPALANRLGGENAVQVLATLLLLPYTKLQRTVITIMSFTTLEYPDGVVRYVWLYDANVEFFKGKHLFLGLAGILVLVFLIVPYTLCLVFFQQLQACSGHRLFHWVNKLKPVFDSYAGPYKDKYRF